MGKYISGTDSFDYDGYIRNPRLYVHRDAEKLASLLRKQGVRFQSYGRGSTFEENYEFIIRPEDEKIAEEIEYKLNMTRKIHIPFFQDAATLILDKANWTVSVYLPQTEEELSNGISMFLSLDLRPSRKQWVSGIIYSASNQTTEDYLYKKNEGNFIRIGKTANAKFFIEEEWKTVLKPLVKECYEKTVGMRRKLSKEYQK